MAAKHQPGGMPVLSIEEIEAEMDRLTAEGGATEKWMSARARDRMADLEQRDVRLMQAFEAGYRMGADSNSWVLFLLVLIPLAIAYPFM